MVENVLLISLDYKLTTGWELLRDKIKPEDQTILTGQAKKIIQLIQTREVCLRKEMKAKEHLAYRNKNQNGNDLYCLFLIKI